MFEKVERISKTVIVQAQADARALAASAVEAEHLLLALTQQPGSDATRVLADAGLDQRAMRTALQAEFERSLAAVGITPGTLGLPEPTIPKTRAPRFGASAKLALSRAVALAKAHGDRRMRPLHILLGVLRAEAGIVPRALDAAGVDVAALATRAEAALTAPGGHG
jgi:ATP-dependent Clp protease ATP-binding subunit ClpA